MRFLPHCLMVFVTVALVGCDKKTDSSHATTSASSVVSTQAPAFKKYDDKTYALGVHSSYPPFSSLDAQGKPIGFDIDILKAIADDQKISFDAIPADHTTDYALVLSGKEQMAAAGITYNEARAQIYATTDSYRTTKNVLVSMRPDLNLKALTDLTGLRVGVIGSGSSHEKHVRDSKVAFKEIVKFKTPYLALRGLMADKIDVAVLNGDVAAPVFKTFSDKKFISNPYAVNGKVEQELIFVINKNYPELVTKVNAGLKNIRANGTYDKISKKWFGDEAPTVVSSAVGATSIPSSATAITTN